MTNMTLQMDAATSEPNSASPPQFNAVWIRVFGIMAIVAMVLLRVLKLDSDAYPRLSWSSALLTDEGFYIHNARNLILFGTESTDQFNNALIMPALHYAQVAWFTVFGVGAVQARSLSVVASLLMLVVFWDALRAAFGMRVANYGALLLGLDHVHLLYNRLALMDTPATLVLVCAFWAFVRVWPGEESAPTLRPHWLVGCALCLVLAYATRGLAALLCPVVLWIVVRTPNCRPALVALISGLGCGIAVYAILWWLPHAAELRRVNAYYLNSQLLPHRWTALWHNVQTGLFGNHYGISSFLWRHTPIWFGIAIVAVLGHRPQATQVGGKRQKCESYLRLWLVIFWLFLIVINYSPSRYYVLFYPAMAGMAGLVLADWRRYAVVVWHSRAKRALLGAFLGYHASKLGCDYGKFNIDAVPTIIALVCGGVLATLSAEEAKDRVKAPSGQIVPVILGLWLVFNLGWTVDWVRTLTYHQRNADHWLAMHLPEGSVVFGPLAPGLCLNNRFRAINIIVGLCNDKDPLAKFAERPRYLVVLEGLWREPWTAQYRKELTQEHRIHTFHPLLRSFFTVGVYQIPNAVATPINQVDQKGKLYR